MCNDDRKETFSIEQIYEQSIKDGKRKPVASNQTFLLTALVGVPLWAGVILPLAVATTVGKAVLSSSSFLTRKEKEGEQQTKPEKFPSVSNLIPRKERKYDLVLLGVTGFAGQLAMEYLVVTYGVNKDIRWAIAGRNESKLNDVKNEVSKSTGDKSVLNVDTIVVDTRKSSTLHALVKDTRSIATSVGPFQLYGSLVVEFCAKYGTNYVDITGEADWHKEMIMKWDDTAQKTGAKIISFCGCDSIPWDLTVSKLSQILREECNDDLVKVECFNDVVAGGLSGGTVATILCSFDENVNKKKFQFNPLLKKADGTKSEYRTVGENVWIPGKVKSEKLKSKYESPFLMSMINAEVVKRSQALRSKGCKQILYREALIFEDFKTAFVNWFGLVAGVTCLLTPLRSLVIPNPGEGPSRKALNKGYLTVAGFGIGSKGNKVETLFYFPKEVGYKDTGRMLVESGLCLALDEEKLPEKNGGFFTPSTGMGDALMERLCKTGSMFAARTIHFQSKL